MPKITAIRELYVILTKTWELNWMGSIGTPNRNDCLNSLDFQNRWGLSGWLVTVWWWQRQTRVLSCVHQTSCSVVRVSHSLIHSSRSDRGTPPASRRFTFRDTTSLTENRSVIHTLYTWWCITVVQWSGTDTESDARLDRKARRCHWEWELIM